MIPKTNPKAKTSLWKTPMVVNISFCFVFFFQKKKQKKSKIIYKKTISGENMEAVKMRTPRYTDRNDENRKSLVEQIKSKELSIIGRKSTEQGDREVML